MTTIADAVAIVDAAVAANIPVLLWGPPGTGKTSAVAATAASRGAHLETVIASIREPSDFGGLPIVETVDGHPGAYLAPPRWARNIVDRDQPTWLFLDELSTAAPATQAALLRVVLDGVVGELALPDTTRFIAAANPTDTAAGGWDLTPALANRFCHIDVTVDADAWADGMTAGFTTPALDDHNGDPNQTRARIAAFIREHPDLLTAVPDDPTAAGRGWPSPRSWDASGRILARLSRPELAVVALDGLVGPAAATSYIAWTETIDLPDPDAIVNNPDLVDWATIDATNCYVALGDIAAWAHTNPDRWGSAFDVYAAALDAGLADIVVANTRAILAAKPADTVAPANILARLAPLMRDAGLLT